MISLRISDEHQRVITELVIFGHFKENSHIIDVKFKVGESNIDKSFHRRKPGQLKNIRATI